MVPGTISWSLILFPLWGAIFIPWAVTYFVLFFDIYWFYRSFSLVLTSTIASRKIKEAGKKDWLQLSQSHKNFNKVTHFIIIPNYKERVYKLRATVQSIADQTFPRDRIFVVLAMEKRESDAKEKAEILISEFKDIFGGVYATYHPDIPGEVKGKSSNEAYAGRQIYEKMMDEKIADIDFATVTSADADASFNKQFFSYLAHSFLTDPKPYNKFWQSAVVYHSNFWSVPAPTRVISFFGSLWRTGLLVQGDRLISCSIYSLSYSLLKRIDFWDTDVIPEDFRIFFKAFYKTQGQVWVEPVFLRTSMDSALSETYMKSLKSRFHQERRWSYGASDDPIFIKWWLTVPNVPFLRKTKMLYHVLLEHALWPVNWFAITISANIITLINPTFGRTALGYNLPVIARIILTSTIVALAIMIIADYRNRPKHLSRSKIRELLFPLEFILMPVAGFFFNSLPAIISHTQLMLGRKMEYKVTEKL